MGFPEFELFIVWDENLPMAPLALPPPFSPWNFPDPPRVPLTAAACSMAERKIWGRLYHSSSQCQDPVVGFPS